MFFDHYKLPDPWYNVKYVMYYWFFTAVKKILRIFGVHTKYGKPENNDGPHKLDDTIGYDATWIGGRTIDKKWIILALDRRIGQNASIGYVYLKLPGIGCLATPTYPNSMENSMGKSANEFELDRFSMSMNKPLRQWNVQFEGIMTSVDNPNVSALVKITARWTSESDVWLLNRDLSAESFAESFALESWRKFAEPILDRSRDSVVHWEQFGRLNAVVELDSFSAPVEIHDAMTVRDRSFGKTRDFGALHRYFYLTAFLRNGRSLVITVVCHKITFSRLFFGFISNDDGTNSNIDWCDLNIHQFGENGRVTEELCFLVRIDGAVHEVQFVADTEHWYRLEKDVVRCEQIGECLFDRQPGECMVQSLYSETSLRAKTFSRPLRFSND